VLASALPAQAALSVAATNSSEFTVAATWSCPLPSNVAAGDVLVVVAVADDLNGTFATPADWTELMDFPRTGNSNRTQVIVKIAAGGETTVTIDPSVDSDGVCVSMRVTGGHASSLPEIGTSAENNTQAIDPPSVTASWGAEANMFCEIVGLSNNNTVDAWSTGYTQAVVEVGGDLSGGITVTAGVACKSASAASDDPGNQLTQNAAGSWVANTIVIRPAAAAARRAVMGGGVNALGTGILD
jgi:hypothetical protein